MVTDKARFHNETTLRARVVLLYSNEYSSRSGKVLLSLYVLNIHRYLVDPASSYMLVFKIKPCMSKCKPLVNCERLIKTVMIYLVVWLLHG